MSDSRLLEDVQQTAYQAAYNAARVVYKFYASRLGVTKTEVEKAVQEGLLAVSQAEFFVPEDAANYWDSFDESEYQTTYDSWSPGC